MILSLEGKRFHIDIEKTQQDYRTRSQCDCSDCRKFQSQVKEKYPQLAKLLGK